LENTRIDPRAQRTRHLLQEALDWLLTRKPLRQITVQDITERAQVNRTTFYAHFEDKYELLSFSVRERFISTLNNRADHWQTYSPERLRLAIGVLCEFIVSYSAHCAPATIDSQQEQLFGLSTLQVQMYTLLLNWIRAEGRVVGMEDEVRAHLMSWAIFGTALEKARGYRAFGTIDGLSAEIFRLIQPMIAAYFPSEHVSGDNVRSS
jgi:AcrR family transcriptional regulator